MDAARQDPVAEIESALAQLRLAQRHGRGPRGGPPLGGTFPDPEHDGPGPHGMRVRPEFGRGRGHGTMGGPHARRLGDALGAARFRLLERLLEGRASVSELADAIGVDQPRASRLIADAAARGFVDRNPDPADARRMVVELSAAGRDFLSSMKHTRRSAVTSALEGFTDDETAQFAALLGRFVEAWPAAR